MESKMWKSTRTIVIIFVVLVLINIAVFAVKYTSISENPFDTGTNKYINLTVSQGESFYSVLDNLKQENILKSPFLTKVYFKLNSFKGGIKPGYYEIPSNTSLGKFIEILENGDIASYKVTIPEGYDINQIADKLAQMGIVSKEAFLTAVKNYPLPSYIKPNPERRYNLEGFLYPDTYNIPKTADANQIISMMLNRFQEVMVQVQKETGVNVPEADYEKYVTVASMIEKEARTDQDRELVSSVIYNRIAKGMKLQIDATVLYALGKHQNIVYYKDLKVPSPYNTYYVTGLPIGPIASPGIESLIAAVKPAKTDYLYYILTANGSHYFTNNYQDFENKKAELIGK